jgi:ParB family chromosome partitioning protein
MELRLVDPRLLRDNPNKPRRTAAASVFDEQFLANVKTIGITQPPIVREVPEGLVIVAGHRRRDAAIAAALPEIWVVVREAADGHDGMRALSENLIRSGLCAVDIWRAIEAQIGDGWSEEGIATALALPPRTIRKFRLLGNIHPALLDRMAQGDEPGEEQLRAIAGAAREEQAAVWKKYRPKKNERVSWSAIANGLKKRRFPAKVARFDEAQAQAFGISWTEDLFLPAGEDARFTDQVEEFLAAQQEWLDANLPKNGRLLELDEYGNGKLPPRAKESWSSKPAKGDLVGMFVCPRTGEIRQRIFCLPEPGGKTKGSGAAALRPDISGKGMALIGTMRTAALQQALEAAPISDGLLLGLLVLAIAAENVRVEQDPAHYRSRTARDRAVARIAEGGVLTADLETIRAAARDALRSVLSCDVGASGSGLVARLAGTAIGADTYLPNMATEEFLKCLSKAGIQRAVSAQGMAPRNTGREMRAALVKAVGEGTYVHPSARFALTEDERRIQAAETGDMPEADPAADGMEDADGRDGSEEEDLGDGVGTGPAGVLVPPATGTADQAAAA